MCLNEIEQTAKAEGGATMKHAVLKLAASALVIGLAATGGNPIDLRSGAAVAANPVIAEERAEAARAALNAQDYGRAVEAAEDAVGAAPERADYRALLGQAYLRAGRLNSAETAFTDTLTLDPDNARARLNLALVEIALGKAEGALNTLQTADDAISAGDKGLALALAGDADGGIALLQSAARAEGATSRTRQNLALAYAIAGKWREARAIAAQDVHADALDRRMAEWARFTDPSNKGSQVPVILGVSPVRDAGQPERLALGGPRAAEQDVRVASAISIELPTPAAEAEDAMATEAVSEPVTQVALVTPVRKVTFAPYREIVQPLPVQASHVRSAVQAPVRAPMAMPTGERVAAGRYVVQIGAYGSEQRAATAWAGAIRRYGQLSSYRPTASMSGARGRLYRVAIGDFGDRRSAEQLCTRMQNAGESCFVRAAAKEMPVQWAQGAGARLASAR